MTALPTMWQQHVSIALRPAARYPCTRRPLSARHRRLHGRCTSMHPTVAAAAEMSVVEQLVASGKVNKTALGKLTVVVLREECTRAGLPADGTKPVLVERLLAWATGQGDGAGAAGDSPAAEAQEPAPAANGLEGDGTAPVAAPSAQPTQQQQQEQQQVIGGNGSSAPAAAAAPATAASAAAAAAPSSSVAYAAAVASCEMSLTFLGTSSGNPTSHRNVSSIAVRWGPEDVFIVDVGEGSRNQLRRAGIDAARVRRIFITHLHGDHCFGVCGMLAEICQARLGTPLQSDPILIYGPPELHALIANTLRLAAQPLTTPVAVVGWVINPAQAQRPRPVEGVAGGLLQLGLAAPDQAASIEPQLAQQWQAEYDQGSDQVVHPGLTWTVALPGGGRVVAAQLQHRIPCWGYAFQEPSQLLPPPPPSVPAAAQEPALEQGQEQAAPAGAAAAEGAAEGEAAQGQQQEQWVRRGRKLVVLGDTCDSTAIAAAARGCDVVSHEATFMKGMERKAEVATHSTSEQAGAFARQIGARSLVLTHFSARYDTSKAEARGGGRGGARGGRGGRFGGRGEGRGGARGAGAGQDVEDLDEGELQRIVREAQSTFGSSRVFLASDYFTFKVWPNSPQPLSTANASSQPDGEDRSWQRRQPAGRLRQEFGQPQGGSGSSYGSRSGGGSSSRFPQQQQQQQQQRWHDEGPRRQQQRTQQEPRYGQQWGGGDGRRQQGGYGRQPGGWAGSREAPQRQQQQWGPPRPAAPGDRRY